MLAVPTTPVPSAPPPSRLVALRNAFLTGLILLLPLLVTIWLCIDLVDLVGSPVRYLLPESLRDNAVLVSLLEIGSTLVAIALITALGYISRDVFGKFFFSSAERFMLRIPGLNAVYGTVRQIVDTFSSPNRALFNKVVLVEFPRKGTWVIGFLTGPARGEIGAKSAADSWTVFVPTTPNPTSGFLLVVPAAEIVELDMTTGEGMKMIISGGAVVPPWAAVKAAEPPK